MLPLCLRPASPQFTRGTSVPQRIDHQQKSPRTEMTSAAGKCLRKMDLPLARCEPSPPYRLREALRLARRCPIALLKPYPDCPLRVEATRARFEFVGRTHREKTHSWVSVKLPLHLRPTANRSNCIAVWQPQLQ